MAMEASRAWFMKLAAAVGDSFVTNRRRPILTLVEDTSGCAHDTLMAAVRSGPLRPAGREGLSRQLPGHLHAALAELGMKIPATPPSLNVFMNIPWTADGRLAWGEPVSTPGSYACSAPRWIWSSRSPPARKTSCRSTDSRGERPRRTSDRVACVDPTEASAMERQFDLVVVGTG